MSATLVMLCSVLIQAYILGTLFHYLVKRDPKLEAFRCDSASLKVLCPVPLALLSHVDKFTHSIKAYATPG